MKTKHLKQANGAIAKIKFALTHPPKGIPPAIPGKCWVNQVQKKYATETTALLSLSALPNDFSMTNEAEAEFCEYIATAIVAFLNGIE